MRLTDFAMLDNISSEGLPQEVEEFLAAGPPPVVVEHAFRKPDSKSFSDERRRSAVDSSPRNLLSLLADFIPKNLPSGIWLFGYVPRSALLPRAAAIIHQGGVGTVAKIDRR